MTIFDVNEEHQCDCNCLKCLDKRISRLEAPNHDDMPGEPCRCYKCLEARLAKCQEEKEKECNHIDMVSNVLTKRIDGLGQCLVDHNHENNEEYRKIKDRLEEIEKSIADQAIKALHTHPEFLRPLSDLTTRISELDERLQDQVDDHCGRIKTLEGLVTYDHMHSTEEESNCIKCRVQKLEIALSGPQGSGVENRLRSLEDRLREWNNRRKI